MSVIIRVSLLFLTSIMILDLEASSTSEIRTIDRLNVIGNVLLIFRLDNYEYPCGDNGLQSLEFNRKNLKTWKGPYLDKHYLDGWGQEFVYIYKCDSVIKVYSLYSIGKNKIDEQGRGDDIVYHEKVQWK